jgi:hypothetical protein
MQEDAHRTGYVPVPITPSIPHQDAPVEIDANETLPPFPAPIDSVKYNDAILARAVEHSVARSVDKVSSLPPFRVRCRLGAGMLLCGLCFASCWRFVPLARRASARTTLS